MRRERPVPPGGYIENPTDEDYATAARWALSQKDHRLALEQAAAAATLRPRHLPHLKLLDEAIASSPRRLEVLRELAEGDGFFGLWAAYGRALAGVHRTGEALACLFRAAIFSPDTALVGWGTPWVSHAREARKVDARALAASIVELVDACRNHRTPGAGDNLDAAEQIAGKVRAAVAGDSALLVARARALRALGRVPEALAVLQEATDWTTLVARGAIESELGDAPAAARGFEEASALRPDDVATLLDLGDACRADARLDDAARTYERALAIDPSQPWAATALAYVRFLTSGAPMPPPAAKADDRARALLFDAEAYGSRLSDPIDPVVRVLRSVQQAPAATAPDRPVRVKVRAERPLAPSARLAFTAILLRIGRDGALEVTHEGSAGPAYGALWRLDGESWVPAPSRPSEGVLETVAGMARAPFEWGAWRLAARANAPGTVDELLAAMVHVPRPPEERDAVQWLHAFQVAAALRIALSPGAPASRLEALAPVAAGVDDWTSAASWLGLRALADEAPELRGAIIDLARDAVPRHDAPLFPAARALALTGGELTTGEERVPFLRLRARVVRELAGVL